MSLDGIDAVFIINLDRSRTRLERMHRQMKAQGIEYERFPAVDGAKLTAQELAAVATPFCRRFCTNSTIGCALSHIGVWRTAAERGLDRVLVMEDDAQLVPDFKEGVARALRDVPKDFDVLLLGCVYLCDKNRKYSLGHSLTRFAAPGKLRDDRRTWGSVFVPEFFGGAHCYVASAKGCAKLLKLIPRANYHIDMDMNHHEINLYAVSPDLAFQGNLSESTIASFGFPRTLTPLLDCIKDSKRIPTSYYLAAPWAQAGGIRINFWVALFLLIGLLFRRAAAPFVTGFFLAELLVGGRVLIPLAVYLAGWGLRAGISRAM